LSGDISEQIMFILYGTGANGILNWLLEGAAIFDKKKFANNKK